MWGCVVCAFACVNVREKPVLRGGGALGAQGLADVLAQLHASGWVGGQCEHVRCGHIYVRACPN